MISKPKKIVTRKAAFRYVVFNALKPIYKDGIYK
jgi:hypothetical protein